MTSTQLAFAFAPPGAAVREFLVTFACPGCGHAWHGASIVPGAWWAVGVTPESTAKHPYCPKCDHRPPMNVASVVEVVQ